MSPSNMAIQLSGLTVYNYLFRLVSAIEVNPGEYSGRTDDTIDKWYKFERPNTYFNQIKEQVKQHVSTLGHL